MKKVIAIVTGLGLAVRRSARRARHRRRPHFSAPPGGKPASRRTAKGYQVQCDLNEIPNLKIRRKE